LNTEKIDFLKNTIQYKIECLVDISEIPGWVLEEKCLDWKINVFSSETIGFVKYTAKEDSERALIEEWEKSNPGRADKALKARLKFIKERKNLVDNYLKLQNLPIKDTSKINHRKT